METEYKAYKSLSIPSSVEHIVEAEALVDHVCSTLPIKEDAYGNVLIAVTEAVNNAIVHGNSNDTSKKVHLEVLDHPNKVEIIIADNGQGFDYDNLPDPTAPENLEKENGRGIFLMKSLSDEVVFENGGKEVKLSFDKEL